MLCPKDFQPCIDDLCRGSNRCFDTGEALYEECHGCKQLVSSEDHEACICEPEYADESAFEEEVK